MKPLSELMNNYDLFHEKSALHDPGVIKLPYL